jgi:mannose-6-phosphate isomerase-like protein (cupin superfamily)
MKTLKAGKPYLWCSCGRSAKQPFCDGSHKGTDFTPVKYKAQLDEDVIFCGCKHTGEAPFCDGTHNNLPGGYSEDDPESPENQKIPTVKSFNDARYELDGGCYVFLPEHAHYEHQDDLQYTLIIGAELGAKYQSQFYMKQTGRRAPVISFGERDVIIFVVKGEGGIVISGQAFEVSPRDGIYVRAGEGFKLTHGLEVCVSPCPSAAKPTFSLRMPENFDNSQPNRVIPVNKEGWSTMAARAFQVLVDKDIGCTNATQFIGNIPPSKAEPHRHLYEEALIILTGKGFMWTETKKAPVKAGDIIFLPSKQEHSLECTNEDGQNKGMDVVGVIFPGDNPSINY